MVKLAYITGIEAAMGHLGLKIAKEDALGIPDRSKIHELPEIKKPTVWEFTVHAHDATRRGFHRDLRLADSKTGYAHSWAIDKLPEPGKATYAIVQPTHTMKYMNFTGTIKDGYGAGDVKIEDRDKVEVLNASPGHITFVQYRGAGPETFTLHKIYDKNWRLYNRTLTRAQHPDLPTHKPDYKEIEYDKIPESDAHILSAKIDDAHQLFYMKAPGDPIRVISYRPSARNAGGIIEHSHKIKSLFGQEVPKELSNTIIRGGIYAMHPKSGKATSSNVLAGLLNSAVFKSRESQKEHGELKAVIYDVERFKGKDVSRLPYGEKLKILEKAKELIPAFSLPRMATTPKEKAKLLNDIKKGLVPETTEGVVIWNKEKYEAPIKAKLKQEHDVYVREFFGGTGKLKDKGVGGFTYSHEPKGLIVGRVGTGFSDELRQAMFKDPTKYIGLVAKIHSQEKYQSGALRAPSFQSFHLEKNPQETLDSLVHA